MSKAKLFLTSREFEVLDLVAKGKRNKEIGVELCISENTVEYHLKCIYKKLKARNRIEAVNRLTSHEAEITGIRS
jgi:LuxR family maltose regulon positive regulatory protein